jgi:hypothetical protein
MNKYAPLIGLAIGAFSWWIVPYVSDSNFEPFDVTEGYPAGQVALCVGAILFGYVGGFKTLFLYLVGAHFGCLIYAFIFGSDNLRGFILVLFFTNLIFFYYPIIVGFLAVMLKYLVNKILVLVGET